MIISTLIGSVGSTGASFTFAFDQIVNADGPVSAPGFTGSNCLLALTPQQAAIINTGMYDGGYYAQWAPGSQHTDYGPYAVLFSSSPGYAVLYGTPYNWAGPENGQWNFPVTVNFAVRFGP